MKRQRIKCVCALPHQNDCRKLLQESDKEKEECAKWCDDKGDVSLMNCHSCAIETNVRTIAPNKSEMRFGEMAAIKIDMYSHEMCQFENHLRLTLFVPNQMKSKSHLPTSTFLNTHTRARVHNGFCLVSVSDQSLGNGTNQVVTFYRTSTTMFQMNALLSYPRLPKS